MRRLRLTAGTLSVAVAMTLAGAALTSPVAASGSYVDADLPEIPTAVAVSNNGVIAASLYDAQVIALVDPDGSVREARLDCSPADVAIATEGQTAWAVCQDSEHVFVIDVASLAVSVASLGVTGLDAIEYLPRVDQLIVASLEGAMFAVERVSEGEYVERIAVDLPKDAPHRVTQVAPLSDGTGAYAITDAGDLLFVDLQFAGYSTVIASQSAQRSFVSIAMGPFDTHLYAAVFDASKPDMSLRVELISMAKGRTLQGVTLDTADFGQIDLAAGNRAVYVSVGVPVETPEAPTGLLALPADDRGRMGRAQAVDPGVLAGSGVSLSADGARAAFGTTGAEALGVIVNDSPYPRAIRMSAKAKGQKVTVTGATTSMRPLTELRVYVKDLTRGKSRFVKQRGPGLVNGEGNVTWSGKAPSKRFALFLEGGGARSQTVTVTRR